jgi:hypothetical protein
MSGQPFDVVARGELAGGVGAEPGAEKFRGRFRIAGRDESL